MRAEQKTDVKNSVGRMAFVILSVLIQAGWILLHRPAAEPVFHGSSP